jgi:hypothetical protein
MANPTFTGIQPICEALDFAVVAGKLGKFRPRSILADAQVWDSRNEVQLLKEREINTSKFLRKNSHRRFYGSCLRNFTSEMRSNLQQDTFCR